NTIRVLVELPPGVTILDRRAWNTVRRLTAVIASDPRIGRAGSITTAWPADSLTLLMYSMLPRRVRDATMSHEMRMAVIEALPRDSLDFNDVIQLARDLRRLDAAAIGGLTGVRVQVGGLPALNVDYEDAIGSRLIPVVALVVVATLI